MPAQDKTESATPKRRGEARNKGQVARSAELTIAISFLAAWAVLKSFGPKLVTDLAAVLTLSFQNLSRADMSEAGLQAFGISSMMTVVVAVAPVAGVMVLIGLVTNIAQVGLHFAPQAAFPKFSRINPGSGLKRFFSLHSFEELGKSLGKISIVGFVGYKVVTDHMSELLRLTGNDFRGSMAFITTIGFELLIKVGFAYLVLALADYMFQKRQFEQGLKMTKQEVKEELRSSELNEQIRARIRSMQRQLARRRMMQSVPQADVVITNPTHFAVALKYDPSKMAAPMVIAKGQRLIAQQIKKLAREHGVPLVENKPLAQALFKAVEVDHEVPRQLYQAVAEVLAFIYRLKKKAS